MITVSAALDLVLDGIEQSRLVRMAIDLPASDYVDFSDCLRSVSLDEQNGTDLPEEVRDTVGFTALGGDVVLSGSVDPGKDETKTVAWLLNPDQTDSPMYRQAVKDAAVTIDIGYEIWGQLELDWVREFTGAINTFALDHDSGSVTLQLVDNSTLYDITPDIPAVVTGAPYNAGLTSAFAMDQIIRSRGQGSSVPPTRANAILCAGLVSTLWAEVGQLATTSSQPLPVFAAGAYGPGLAGTNPQGAGTVLGENVWAPATTPLADVYIEALVTGLEVSGALADLTTGQLRGSSGTGTAFLRGVDLVATDTSVRLQLDGTTILTINGPFAPGPHQVAAHVRYIATDATSGIFTANLWVDGIIHPTTYVAPQRDTDQIRYAAPSNLSLVGAYASGGAVISGLQITTEPAPFPIWPWTPSAILDMSLNPLTVVPEIPAGSKGSDELQAAAAAELGYARFDRQGTFRFLNRVTIAGAPVARTITTDNAIKPGYGTDFGSSTVYDHIQVPFTEWSFAARAAVFVLETIKKIPAQTVVQWTQPLAGLAALIDVTAQALPDGQNPSDGNTWYRASADAAGATAHPGLSIGIAQISAGSVLIVVNNKTTLDAWLTTPATYTDLPAGSAASGLWIGGVPVTPADEAIVDVVYGAGTKPPLLVTSNAYLQHQSAAQDIGEYLLPQLIVAIRDFTNVSIIPDSRLEVADPVHMQDFYRSGIDEYARIWGRRLDIEFPPPGETGGTWSMDLDLRALTASGGWLLDVPGRSELDSTTYLYG